MPGGRRGFQHSAAASRWHLSHVLDPVAKSERRRAAASRGPAGAEAQVPIILNASARSASGRKGEQLRLYFTLHEFEEGWRITKIPQN